MNSRSTKVCERRGQVVTIIPIVRTGWIVGEADESQEAAGECPFLTPPFTTETRAPPLSRRIGSIVAIAQSFELEQLIQTFFSGDLRAPTQNIFCLTKVGQSVAHIARSASLIDQWPTDHLRDAIDTHGFAWSNI